MGCLNTIPYQDILIAQGADFKIRLRIKDENGNYVNLAGYTGSGLIKDKCGGTLAATFVFAIEDTYYATWSLNQTVTAAIPVPVQTGTTKILGEYVYDLKLVSLSGDDERALEGKAFVSPQV